MSPGYGIALLPGWQGIEWMVHPLGNSETRILVLLLCGCGLAALCVCCNGQKSVDEDFYWKLFEIAGQFSDICWSAEGYRFHEGRYPKDLDELVGSKHWERWSSWSKPTRTPKGWIIEDRWNGKPIKYVSPGMSDGEPYAVYCFGPNGMDDGGKHDDITATQLLDIVHSGKTKGFAIMVSTEEIIVINKRLNRLLREEEMMKGL